MTDNFAAPDRGMRWTSQWRVRYRPGNWLVLSGPTSLVVLQPAAPQWSDLINTVWEAVLGAASIDELAAALASFRLNEMPDLAALFWGAEGMRSLIRGRMLIRDARSDTPVASGAGIQTWAEIGLEGLRSVRITPGEESSSTETSLALPLVVGAVQAGEVLLDASREVQLVSPQGTPVGASEGAGQPPEPAPAERAVPEPRTPGVEDAHDPAAEHPPTPGAEGAQNPGVEDTLGPSHAVEPPSNGSGITDPSPPSGPAEASDSGAWSRPVRAVVAVLRPSSGGRTDVDRPVLIGRAPEAKRVGGDQLPYLITVASPSHDISRTHVQVQPEYGQLVITDMHSTNGTILIGADGSRTQLSPGTGVTGEYGSLIDLGDGVTIAIDQPDS